MCRQGLSKLEREIVTHIYFFFINFCHRHSLRFGQTRFGKQDGEQCGTREAAVVPLHRAESLVMRVVLGWSSDPSSMTCRSPLAQIDPCDEPEAFTHRPIRPLITFDGSFGTIPASDDLWIGPPVACAGSRSGLLSHGGSDTHR